MSSNWSASTPQLAGSSPVSANLALTVQSSSKVALNSAIKLTAIPSAPIRPGIGQLYPR